MKMGRRLSRGCGIGYVSLWICALPAAHFDRNERYAYFGDRAPPQSTIVRNI